jgi:hypothetical protein
MDIVALNGILQDFYANVSQQVKIIILKAQM